MFYESIARDFDSLINPYDLERRLEIVYDELLPQDLSDVRLLDLGCGSGWFSEEARARGAQVTSLDISISLVRITRDRTRGLVVTADASRTPFAADHFQIIISSEMLEHLREPAVGIEEIGRILAPGGTLVLTTPNRRWLWLVSMASKLGWRSFRGYENFLGFEELAQLLKNNGLAIEDHFGFHPWPFQVSFLQSVSRLVGRALAHSRPGRWMLNQAVRAHKPTRPSSNG